MKKNNFDVPILFLIFRRKDKALRVIESIAKVKPRKFYISQDGPRNKSEMLEILETREAILSKIDWDCKIYKRYSKKHLGIRRNIVESINWVFETSNKVIVLEDDLLVNISFFLFCKKLLQKYENNDRVISISGNNFQFGKTKTRNSYYFSRYIHSWGWATWKRAWRLYDDEMKDWTKLKKKNYLKSYLSKPISAIYWNNIFNLTSEREIDSWAYCWTYTAFKNKKLTIIPSKNLISNMGYGGKATHTLFKIKSMGMRVETLNFPLKHPRKIKINSKADDITEKNVYFNLLVLISLTLRIVVSKTRHIVTLVNNLNNKKSGRFL